MIRLIREIRGQLIIRECFFFEHESHESNESFRLRPGMYSWEISVQLNIRECFFSNTNHTNLTNLLGCDPVCIRGRLVFNLIYANVFFEHESHESDESCKCVALALSRVRYWTVLITAKPTILHSSFFILHCYDILSV